MKILGSSAGGEESLAKGLKNTSAGDERAGPSKLATGGAPADWGNSDAIQATSYIE